MSTAPTIILDPEWSPQGASRYPTPAHHVDLRPWAAALRLRTSRHIASQARDMIAEHRRTTPGTWLSFLGSGDFHHLTLLLLESLSSAPPFTLIVIDNHPDWAVVPPKYHCGNWVASARKLPNIERVILVGQDSADLAWPAIHVAPITSIAHNRVELRPYRDRTAQLPFVWTSDTPESIFSRQSWGSRATFPGLATPGIRASFQLLAQSLKGRDVYLSIDKDVLDPRDVSTDWEQGQLRLDELLAGIRDIASAARIIGADVCGDPAYAPLRGIIKRIDAGRWFAPWTPPSHEQDDRHREVNLAIHDTLGAFRPALQPALQDVAP